MQKESIRRAVIYARVSTGEQAEHGTSLAGQLDACRSKASAIGAEVVGAYEDAGISGALNEARPGMQAALRDLEAGKANTLIIANLSRFSRDREHQSAIKKRVEAAGARLVFCDMEFSDTPEGDLAFGIMGTFADYERKVIKERTTKGRRRRAEEGIQPARNHSPFGYHVPTKKDVLSGVYPLESLGVYQVVQEQAKWAKEIFVRFAGGQSLRSIARWLTESCVPTPRGAIVWNQSTLFRLLQHPLYKGEASFGRFERQHDEGRAKRGLKTSYLLKERPKDQWINIEAPAIIDEATWNACQMRMQQNRDMLRGRPQHRYLLTSLMRCPKCDRKMRSYRMRHSPKNKESAYYHLYECRFARPSSNIAGESCCNKQHRGYWAEPLVLRAIQEVSRHPNLMLAAVEAYKKARAENGLQQDTKNLEQQLAELQKQEKATVKAQITGVMAGADSSIYESMLHDLSIKRDQIIAALKRAGYPAAKGQSSAQGEDEAVIANRAIAAVDEVLNAPDNLLTPAEKQGLLVRIIEAIYPDGKEGLRIVLKPSFVANDGLNVQYFTT